MPRPILVASGVLALAAAVVKMAVLAIAVISGLRSRWSLALSPLRRMRPAPDRHAARTFSGDFSERRQQAGPDLRPAGRDQQERGLADQALGVVTGQDAAAAGRRDERAGRAEGQLGGRDPGG